MLLSIAALATMFAANSLAAPVERPSIDWNECKDVDAKSNLTYQCSTLSVPLDYTNTSRGELDLQLLRVPAEQQPAKGSVLFNFGGPGAEARNTLVLQAEALMLWVIHCSSSSRMLTSYSGRLAVSTTWSPSIHAVLRKPSRSPAAIANWTSTNLRRPSVSEIHLMLLELRLGHMPALTHKNASTTRMKLVS